METDAGSVMIKIPATKAKAVIGDADNHTISRAFENYLATKYSK